MERKTASSLVPFQSFKLSRSKLRHALTATSHENGIYLSCGRPLDLRSVWYSQVVLPECFWNPIIECHAKGFCLLISTTV